MKKKVIYLLLMLIFTIPELIHAQKIRGGAGFLKLGYANSPGSSTLFNKIAPENIRGFKDNFFAIGLDGYYRTGNIILGLDGYIGGQETRSIGTLYVDAFTAANYLKFGWVILGNEEYWLYPSVGLGYSYTGTNEYIIEDRYFTEPYQQAIVSPSVNVGINADFISTKYPFGNNRYSGGLILGIRTGYHFSNGEFSWRGFKGDKLEILPSYSNNGFYFMLSIGGGVFVK